MKNVRIDVREKLYLGLKNKRALQMLRNETPDTQFKYNEAIEIKGTL